MSSEILAGRSPASPPAKTATIAVAVAVMLAAGSEASADIVNVQSALTTEAEEGLTGSVTGSADWREGNSTRLTLGLAPVARWRGGDHRVIGLIRGELFRANDGEFDRKTFEHLRYRYLFSDRLLAEVFVQHEFNEVRRLDLRALVGFGPKYQLVDADKLQVGVGVAYMLEYERLQGSWKIDEDADVGERDVLGHRISSYLTGSYELEEGRLQLVQTLYAQPLLTSPGDVRLLSESLLVVKVTQSVSLSTSFTLALDSRPPFEDCDPGMCTGEGGAPDEVEPYDTALKTSLTYSF